MTAASLGQGHDAIAHFSEEHGHRRSGVRMEVYGHVGADGDVQGTTLAWLLG